MKKILLDLLVICTIALTALFVYRTYGDAIQNFVFDTQSSTMYVRSVPINVTIADEEHEHAQGLSGVEKLDQFEGKLFIFPDEAYYSMWMKDMLFPIDILWINNDLKVVHIEENVTPETFPESFSSNVPARFVLELNAFFVETEKIQVGDKVLIPPKSLPKDLVEILQ